MQAQDEDEAQIVGRILQNTYRVERLIGKGAMGVVYGAAHVRLTRRYAVKLLNPLVATSAEAVGRFKREAQVTSSLGHPNIVEVFDFNHTDEGRPYIVMELLEGEPLATRIGRQGRLGFAQTASIFGQAASAMGAAHSQGIVHRDLKPENIMLCARGGQDDFVKVVDFGLAKILGYHSNLTGSHELLGSPYYMAPEQAEQRAADVDLRTDVYGMGVIVYMMLSGHPPFHADSLPTLLYQIVHKAPPSLCAMADIPQTIDDVVQVALRKRQEDRYQSMESFWRAFQRAMLDESMSNTVAPPSDPGVIRVAQQAPNVDDAEDKEIGRQVGNYVIRRKLSQGGMGVVYLAEHPEIGRQVAIKILAAHLLQFPTAAERFVAEAKAVTRIKHPNIIDIYDFGRLEDGRLYYVMELLEGVELSEVMSRGKMTPAEVVPYLDQICQALQAAHDQGIVHRDLKPENIFELSRPPLTVKVLDFGIAKLLEPDRSTKGVTSTGMVMGSPLTMAPEQAAGLPGKVGPWTDLYSLGVVVYWMLAGQPPFSAEASGLLLAKHITEAPPPLRETEPTVPPAVAELVDRCLEKDPARRPGSAAELAREFAAVVESAGSAPRPQPPARAKTGPKPRLAAPTTMGGSAAEVVARAPARSRTAWWSVAAAVCAIGLALGFVAMRGGGSAGRASSVSGATTAATAAPTTRGSATRDARALEPAGRKPALAGRVARKTPPASKPARPGRVEQPALAAEGGGPPKPTPTRDHRAAKKKNQPEIKNAQKKRLPFDDLEGKREQLRFDEL